MAGHVAPVGPRSTMARIVVCGTTGSGKSTLARTLARRLGSPHIELDALWWGPNWVYRPIEEFRASVDTVTSRPRWVVDGNYSRARDLTWGRADTLVWLDYRLATVIWRLLRRSVARGIRRTKLWHGNRENLAKHFFTKESLFLWAFNTHPRQRREFPVSLAQPVYRHLHVVRLRSPAATRRWLTTVATG